MSVDPFTSHGDAAIHTRVRRPSAAVSPANKREGINLNFHHRRQKTNAHT